ncbi:MFS transporter [Streptomyces sp. MST-110588]|uniref:MFS transporter n=1 Tax=Streptomyces sp. MST-110588 TaxID=2833628 RepID=UPI001F5C4BA4|nr:MFS transporter [Streptomyces sp. MST-110588]UNO40265.1 MFS transporter [Streptomyces sp. MST-110588]
MKPSRTRLLGPTYTITVICAGSSMPTSLYTEYARRFRLSPFAVTGLFTVYVAVLLPTMLLCGGLSDRWGRRPVAFAGLALAASASTLLASAPLALAHAPQVLYAGRLLQGVAAALTSGAATAALADAAREEPDAPEEPGAPQEGGATRARGGAVSLASLAISIGSASGPLLSGTLAAVAPPPSRPRTCATSRSSLPSR